MNNKSKHTFVDAPYRVYLAAPFFNPVQKEWCAQTEIDLDLAGHSYFSPRLQHGPNANMKDPAYAAEVFDRNIRAMSWANVIIANIDWLLPEGHEIRQLDSQSWNGGDSSFKSPPLNVPDTGVTFELGHIYQRVQAGTMLCILVSKLATDSAWKPNLMLSRCSNLVAKDSKDAIHQLNLNGSYSFGKVYTHEGDVV